MQGGNGSGHLNHAQIAIGKMLTDFQQRMSFIIPRSDVLRDALALAFNQSTAAEIRRFNGIAVARLEAIRDDGTEDPSADMTISMAISAVKKCIPTDTGAKMEDIHEPT